MASEPFKDPVVEYYKKNVDRSLLLENLKLTHEQRLEKFFRTLKLVEELQRAGKNSRKKE